jgi:hypothetical protein
LLGSVLDFDLETELVELHRVVVVASGRVVFVVRFV